jgi:hypothetical protein
MMLEPAAKIPIEEFDDVAAKCIVADLSLPSTKGITAAVGGETRAHAQPEVQRLVVELETEDCYGLEDKNTVQNSRVIAVDFVSRTFCLDQILVERNVHHEQY